MPGTNAASRSSGPRHQNRPSPSHALNHFANATLGADNSGDYGAFSQDLSLPAKLIVDAETFADFRYENLPITGPYMAITSVQAEPGRQHADHASYLVHARFEYQDAVALLVTVSRSGEVEGLELYPRDE